MYSLKYVPNTRPYLKAVTLIEPTFSQKQMQEKSAHSLRMLYIP